MVAGRLVAVSGGRVRGVVGGAGSPGRHGRRPAVVLRVPVPPVTVVSGTLSIAAGHGALTAVQGAPPTGGEKGERGGSVRMVV